MAFEYISVASEYMRESARPYVLAMLLDFLVFWVISKLKDYYSELSFLPLSLDSLESFKLDFYF